MSVTVNVVGRSGKQMGTYEVPAALTLKEFKEMFARKNKRFYPSRQAFSIEVAGGQPVKLSEPEKQLQRDYGVKQDTVLTFKDLGPQISWRTVFLVEYFGPILIHAIFFYFSRQIYGKETQHGYVQKLAFYCVLFHYVKRELETIFVHRFSLDTMPLFNLFKNSTHYWILSGVLMAYPIYHPEYTQLVSEQTANVYAALFLVCELGNFQSHVTLMNLRPAGTRTRGIPRGMLFELVSCANYTWELGAWFFFSLMVASLSAWLFFAVSFVQIYAWAVKKHIKLRKEFPNYPRGRKALVPFLL